MFVQTIETESGLQVICWSTCYEYKESGRYCNMRKGVWRNGKKSSNAKYAEALGKELPYLLKRGTYKDALYAKKIGQRERIEIIFKEFQQDNRTKIVLKLNKHFSLPAEVHFGVDALGVFVFSGWQEFEVDAKDKLIFAVGPNNYHLRDSIINLQNIEEAVEGLCRKLAGELEATKAPKKKEQLDLSTVWVTRQHSLDSGNCIPGTDRFIALITRKFPQFRITKMRADALLKIKDNADTRRAVRQAIKNQKI